MTIKSKPDSCINKRQDSDQYLEIFLNDIPLMDVRAPVEFNKGAFPNSTNIPILDDIQREAIGTRYKQAGQDEAIALGLQLATPEIRQQRFKSWIDFINNHPNGYLYCFRGGLRSKTTQAWLQEQGYDYPLIKGGYKAMRTFLLEEMARNIQHNHFIVLAGMTGSGKTRVLKKMPHFIDLEGLANHKGSAFGRDLFDFQPSQIDFENQLSIQLLKHHHCHSDTPLLIEDEGKFIGRITTPPELYQRMLTLPRIFLERTTEERIQIIREEYIDENWPLYLKHFKNQAPQHFQAFIMNNLERIKNRLGGLRYQQVKSSFDHAIRQLLDSGNSEMFNEGIGILLTEYYDPMYRYQLSKKPVDICFSGKEADILDWVNHYRASK